jgi:hypothetical protein
MADPIPIHLTTPEFSRLKRAAAAEDRTIAAFVHDAVVAASIERLKCDERAGVK